MLRKAVAYHGGGCVILAKQTGERNLELIGTAFLCHSKGYLLTSAHAFSLSDKLGFIPPLPLNQFNPSELVQGIDFIRTTVVQFDAKNDVALLKIEEASGQILVPPKVFGDANLSPVGATLCYLGFPHAHNGQHALKVSGTFLSSKVISSSGTKQLVLDSMAEACNSGGPLIDVSTNQIIGIISRRFSPVGSNIVASIGNHVIGSESMISYATTIDYALALMNAEGLHE